MFIWLIREQDAKGGRGSGNWGHVGRKGLKGGSAGLKDTPLDRLQVGGERYVAAKEPKNGRSTIARRTEKVSRRIDENTLTPAESGIVYGANQRGGSQARLQAMENIISSRATLARLQENISPQAVIDRRETITTIQDNAKIVAKNTPKASKKKIGEIIDKHSDEPYDEEDNGWNSGRTQQEIADIMKETLSDIELPQEIVSGIEKGTHSVNISISNEGYEFAIKKGYSDVMRVRRNFEDSETVHNDWFKIDESFRGSNIATQLYASQEKALIKAGVKRVTIQANLDVGGYAWARMGFSYDENENFYSLADRISGKSDGWNTNVRLDRITGNSSFSDEIYDSIQGKQPYEVATMSWARNGKTVTGKDLLLGTNWYAVKNLDSSDVGYQLGQAYYESKGVTP